jgi:prolyl-tRNA synthetase
VGLKVPVYADLELKGCAGAVTGGNKSDTHLAHVSLDRDADVTEYRDICFARNGDRCPKCGEKLREKRGIEVGHVFKLGTKYSESMDACFLDENGQKKPFVMGCYGIGVTRTLQSVIEQSHDDNGIIWPASVAPYHATILVLNPDDAESMKTAESLAANLEEKGVEVLLDDRDERPGVKFKDADLLGLPLRIVVSERSLAGRNVEIKQRVAGKPELVPVDQACETINDLIRCSLN